MTRIATNPAPSELPHDLLSAPGVGEQDKMFNLAKATAYFRQLEGQCDDAIQMQDDLIRQVTLRSRQALADLEGDGRFVSLNSACSTNAVQRENTSLPAQRIIGDEDFVPLAKRGFVQSAQPHELDQIEVLEFEILQLRKRMVMIEVGIMESKPQTPHEIAIKLKFVANLLIDGGEVDVEAFATLADQLADRLLATYENPNFA